jgi:beta-phosphoglucomutase-like phosphatase (HAD superfamily)
MSSVERDVCDAERLGVQPEECIVIEDSQIGVDAAIGAGMRCIVTYTVSTKNQAFAGAERILENLGDDPPLLTVADLSLAQATA